MAQIASYRALEKFTGLQQSGSLAPLLVVANKALTRFRISMACQIRTKASDAETSTLDMPAYQ
jgi:hypothetical protein